MKCTKTNLIHKIDKKQYVITFIIVTIHVHKQLLTKH